MGANDAPLPSEKAPLSKGDIDSIIELCYERYFSPNALRQATTIKDQKHINLLLRLRDFATVVECNRSMRAGDIGRLMNVWRRWSIMAQGIKGLNKYAIHLPRMVLLLTRVLPPGLRLVLCHSLLISPKGRPGHFVAKDFYLEVQNYWLKYFYNNTGRGTEIRRLMEVYSINISMVGKSKPSDCIQCNNVSNTIFCTAPIPCKQHKRSFWSGQHISVTQKLNHTQFTEEFLTDGSAVQHL